MWMTSGCGMTKTIFLPDGTAAGVVLKNDIVKMIDLYQKANEPGCFYRIADIKPAGIDGSTILEDWIVETCGKTVVYSVKLTPSASGGTDFGVKRND